MLRGKDYKILNCIILLEKICSEGQGKIRLSDVAFWTHIKKMTVHRHLIKLEGMGMVSRIKEKYKNTEIHYWKTEENAHDLERLGEMWK